MLRRLGALGVLFICALAPATPAGAQTVLPPGFAETTVEYDDDEHWLQFSRGKVRVVCNFGSEALETALEGTLLLATEPEAVIADGSLTLPGESAAVVRVN